MEKLKCSSCGGEITVDNDKEYGTCPYCGTKYKLNEDINFNIKIDDNTKEILSNGAKHFSKLLLIPIVLFAFVFVSIIVFGFIKSSRADKQYQERVKQQQEQAKKIQEQIMEEAKKQQEKIDQENKKWEEESEKSSFNFQFINDNGTQKAFFLKSTLDEIIQSNKTNDRKVSLVFNGTETKDESEIINIKHSLDGDYEVSFNYDDSGYINKIIVDKIN